jgi:hypothetical protein
MRISSESGTETGSDLFGQIDTVRIPNPDPDFYLSRVPDPGVKKVPDPNPGSGSATMAADPQPGGGGHPLYS